MIEIECKIAESVEKKKENKDILLNPIEDEGGESSTSTSSSNEQE